MPAARRRPTPAPAPSGTARLVASRKTTLFAPADLDATAPRLDVIALSWTAPPSRHPLRYELQVQEQRVESYDAVAADYATPDDSWDDLPPVEASTSTIAEGLNAATSLHRFRVRAAVVGKGTSGSWSSVATLAPPTPSPPKIGCDASLDAFPDGSPARVVRLSWGQPPPLLDAWGLRHYQVEVRGTAAHDDEALPWKRRAVSLEAGRASCLKTDPSHASIESRLRFVYSSSANGGGGRRYSPWSATTTRRFSDAGDHSAPSRIGNVHVAGLDEAALEVEWSPSSTPVAAYDLSWEAGGKTEKVRSAKGRPRVKLKGIEPALSPLSEVYTLRVRGVAASGAAGQWSEPRTTEAVCWAPTVVSSVVVDGGNGLRVAWDAPASALVADLLRSWSVEHRDPRTPNTKWRAHPAPRAADDRVHLALKRAAKSREVRVRAVYGNGVLGPWSEVAVAAVSTAATGSKKKRLLPGKTEKVAPKYDARFEDDDEAEDDEPAPAAVPDANDDSDSEDVDEATTKDQIAAERTAVDALVRERLSKMRGDGNMSLAGLFEHLDADDDGHLDLAELADAISEVGIVPREASMIMRAIDADGDGLVSFREFSRYMRTRATSAAAPAAAVAAVFDSVAIDMGSAGALGDIARRRLRAHMSELGMDVRELYDVIDVNGDGTLTVKELNEALSSIGLTKAEAFFVITTMGTGRQGRVGFFEFDTFLRRRPVTSPEALSASERARHGRVREKIVAYMDEKDLSAADLFHVADVDESGTVSLKELAAVLAGVGCNRTEARYLLQAVDTDRSGMIDPKEWYTFLDPPDADEVARLEREQSAAYASGEMNELASLQERLRKIRAGLSDDEDGEDGGGAAAPVLLEVGQAVHVLQIGDGTSEWVSATVHKPRKNGAYDVRYVEDDGSAGHKEKKVDRARISTSRPKAKKKKTAKRRTLKHVLFPGDTAMMRDASGTWRKGTIVKTLDDGGFCCKYSSRGKTFNIDPAFVKPYTAGSGGDDNDAAAGPAGVVLHLISASRLSKGSFVALRNPYCIVRVDGEKADQTEVVYKTNSPSWGHWRTLPLGPEERHWSVVVVECWDHNTVGGDGFLGRATITSDLLVDPPGGDAPVELDFLPHPEGGSKYTRNKHVKGTLTVAVVEEAEGHDDPPPPPPPTSARPFSRKSKTKKKEVRIAAEAGGGSSDSDSDDGLQNSSKRQSSSSRRGASSSFEVGDRVEADYLERGSYLPGSVVHRTGRGAGAFYTVQFASGSVETEVESDRVRTPGAGLDGDLRAYAESGNLSSLVQHRLQESMLETRSNPAELHDWIDEDGSGKVSLEELSDQLAVLGFSRAETAYVISEIDTDKDGEVSKNEFVRWVSRTLKKRAVSTAESERLVLVRDRFAAFVDAERCTLANFFFMIDTDGDGDISVAELEGALERKLNFTPTEAKFVMSAVDADASGGVCYPEFLAFMDSSDPVLDDLKRRRKAAFEAGQFKEVKKLAKKMKKHARAGAA